MSQILLDISEDSLLALRVSAEEAGEQLRMAAAIKLFELGRLSSGAAAEPARKDLSRPFRPRGRSDS
ncbi:MAG TPA: UPF0175 family protein [Thermoanaerobaculia bacterium]|nr:UPF0175 family protein [Thermoanaerobaculia bacterium]